MIYHLVQRVDGYGQSRETAVKMQSNAATLTGNPTLRIEAAPAATA